jgi:rubrerythrin
VGQVSTDACDVAGIGSIGSKLWGERMTRFWLVRFRWRYLARSDRAVARSLAAFARTEQGSFLSLRLAANQTASVERQALYLRHAADEARHARRFHEQGEARLGYEFPLVADAEDIFQLRGELGFLAFVYHAERRGRMQFEVIAQELERRGDADLADFFRGIAGEELHHERYAYEQLVELAQGELRAQSEVARVVRWELWRSFRRSGRTLAGGVYSLAIYLLLPVLWLYGAVLRRTSRVRGFHS